MNAYRAAGRPRVIVTRPGRDAGDWVAQLQGAGFAADALPLITIAPATDAQPLAAAWQNLQAYAACLFVSGNAVTHFFAHPARTALPAGTRFMAPGPGTVAALLAAGVPPAQIDAPAADAPQFDSESLWDVVGPRDWQGRRVLVVRGQSPGPDGAIAASQGREWLGQRWHAAGARVDFVGAYQRCAPTLDAAQLALVRQAATDGSVWLFSSSEAVLNLDLALAATDAGRLDWRGARALATHPRIAETLRAGGWGVVGESRPALDDIKAVLQSIESGYP